MRRGRALLTTALIIFSSCTSHAATKYPKIADSADKLLIRDLYYNYSQSWNDGVNDGISFIVNNRYPTLERRTFDQCRRSLDQTLTPEGLPDDYSELVVPDMTSIEPAPDWTATENDGTVVKPSGHVYILRATATLRSASLDANSALPVTADRHAAVLAGRAYFFSYCD